MRTVGRVRPSERGRRGSKERLAVNSEPLWGVKITSNELADFTLARKAATEY